MAQATEALKRSMKDMISQDSQLKEWLKNLDRASEKVAKIKLYPEFVTQYISRYGFQAPEDISLFLNSPAGETVKEIIGEELAEELARQEAESIARRDQEIYKNRRLGFLFLYLLYKKEAYAHHMEEIQDDINKKLKEMEKHNLESREKGEKGEEHTSEGSPLEDTQTLHQYEQQAKAVENKYETFNEGVDEADTLLEKLLLLNEQSLDTLLNGPAEAKETIEKQINQRIDALTKAIEANSSIVHQLLNDNQDEEARELLNHSIADNIQIEALEDFKAVLKGTKYFYKSGGEPVKSLKEVDFVLPQSVFKHLNENRMRLFAENGQFYLISQDQQSIQRVNHLTVDQQEAAHSAFKALKTEPELLMSVRKLIDHNKSLETTFLSERKARLEQQREQKTDKIVQQLGEQLIRQSLTPSLRPTPQASNRRKDEEEMQPPSSPKPR